MEEENQQATEPEPDGESEADLGEVLSEPSVQGREYSAASSPILNFLKNNFYIIESNTDISSDLLNAGALLSMDMTLQQDSSAPQILIYHTHSQEGFADSVEGDVRTTIVGVATA